MTLDFTPSVNHVRPFVERRERNRRSVMRDHAPAAFRAPKDIGGLRSGSGQSFPVIIEIVSVRRPCDICRPVMRSLLAAIDIEFDAEKMVSNLRVCAVAMIASRPGGRRCDASSSTPRPSRYFKRVHRHVETLVSFAHALLVGHLVVGLRSGTQTVQHLQYE